jgi:uncharacterized membrane protein HdeD (DUF308 family)
MDTIVLPLVGLIVQIAGFVYLCRLGARLSKKLEKTSQWLPIGAGAVTLAAGMAICLMAEHPLTFLPQTAAFFCVAFGGGLVARPYNRITTGR